jgi:hypothetical protein
VGTAADEVMAEIPEKEVPTMETSSDEISEEVLEIITKDQESLSGLKDKMDALESRVSENELELGLAGEEEDLELEEDPELVKDPETGLLVDPETGEIYDKTGEVIEEEFQREYKIKTVIEALAFKKANRVIRENFNAYNRDAAIVGGINSLIILEAFDHVFGRKTSYMELKKKLHIK